jgi:hypothetical protein
MTSYPSELPLSAPFPQFSDESDSETVIIEDSSLESVLHVSTSQPINLNAEYCSNKVRIVRELDELGKERESGGESVRKVGGMEMKKKIFKKKKQMNSARKPKDNHFDWVK